MGVRQFASGANFARYLGSSVTESTSPQQPSQSQPERDTDRATRRIRARFRTGAGTAASWQLDSTPPVDFRNAPKVRRVEVTADQSHIARDPKPDTPEPGERPEGTRLA